MHEFTLLSDTISIIDLKKFENMLLLLMPKFQHIQPKNYQSFFSERRKHLEKYFVNSNLDFRLFVNQEWIKE